MTVVFAAVITAAGTSSRMGWVKKEFLPLEGRCDGAGKPLTVLGAAVSAFAGLEGIGLLVIAAPPGAGGEAAARASLPAGLCAASPGPASPRLIFAAGGETRRSSVHLALEALKPYQPEYVLIHDGARPWVSRGLIRRIMAAVVRYQAVIPLLPLVETPKEIEEGPNREGVFFIKRHLRRAGAGTAQTPQAFAFPGILEAHEKAAMREKLEGYEYTDDAEVWGEFEGPVAAIPGEAENRKITFPGDISMRGSVC